MVIRSAEFIISNTDFRKAPPPDKPEFAFIGRSNVGKSSLINSLVNRKQLAKTSTQPGKTQTINHFIVNESWYLVDLPGYGFAGVSRGTRYRWGKMIEEYLVQRPNLYCTFVLIDSRHVLLETDAGFIRWMGEQQLPLAVVLTKTDKLSKAELTRSVEQAKEKLLRQWETLPPLFVTSAKKKEGTGEILDFIEKVIRGNRTPSQK